MLNFRAVLMVSLVALTLGGCPSAAPSDAGDSATPDTATVSDATCVAPTDAGIAATGSPLFGPCRSDADCPAGGTCLSQATEGWPGGFCSRGCTSSEDC